MAGGGCVVLVHGLGRTHRSMWALAWALGRSGYTVINWRYPSTKAPIAVLASRLDRELTARLQGVEGQVHFVTHSMGGIVVRRYLADVALANVGRVVMLAPPNQGSEVVDRLRDWWLFRRATGPAGEELRTGAGGPSDLPGIPVELGIIAGRRPVNPIFSRWIGGANDGKVGVARTALEGMTDFLVVNRGHTWLAWQPVVIQQVQAFLEEGKFRSGQDPHWRTHSTG